MNKIITFGTKSIKCSSISNIIFHEWPEMTRQKRGYQLLLYTIDIEYLNGKFCFFEHELWFYKKHPRKEFKKYMRNNFSQIFNTWKGSEDKEFKVYETLKRIKLKYNKEGK